MHGDSADTGGKLAQQARLPDPRLTLEQEDARPSACSLGEGVVKAIEHAGTPDEWAPAGLGRRQVACRLGSGVSHFRVDIRHEPEAAAALGADHSLPLSVVTEGHPQLVDRRTEGAVAHHNLAPNLVEQLVARHGTVTVLDQVGQQRAGLRCQRHQLMTMP